MAKKILIILFLSLIYLYPKENFSGRVINSIREIEVMAFQFGFKPNKIIVKKGEKVRLILKSSDVVHGIEIKEYKINRVIKPDKEEIVEFVANKTGVFHFHCSIFCGIGHSRMHGELIVK